MPSFLRLRAVVQARGTSSSVVHNSTNEKSATRKHAGAYNIQTALANH